MCFFCFFSSFHTECTVACTGQVTEAQINALQDGCDAKGRKAYMQNGGNEDDYMMEMEKGASTAAGSVAENCFDAAFLREGLRYLFSLLIFLICLSNCINIFCFF